MANTAATGGIVSCAILIVVGILGIICVFISSRRRHLSKSVASDNSDSFQIQTDTSTNSSRASSQSRSGSIASVRTLKSHISSVSEASKNLGSIISVVSRGTMTSKHDSKGTNTENGDEVRATSRRSRSPKDFSSSTTQQEI